MSLDPMPSARELRAMAAQRGVLPPPNSPATAAKGAKAPSVRPWHPYRSKLEADYAKHLELQKAADIVTAWAYEIHTFTIGAGAKYTPDFHVVFTDGRVEWHEVKGYRREAGMVRLKVAALAFPREPFVLVERKNGQWHHTTIGPR